MRITVEDVLAVEPSARIHCAERQFDYVDAVGFSAKPAIPLDAKVLWSTTKSSTREDLSWYGVSFDRSTRAIELSAKNPRWTLLTDSDEVAAAAPGRCIVVADVPAFLEKLHRYVLAAVSPVVVGVTGSVGKTTCTALLEDILSPYGKTLRIYAKRITPLSLFETVINQLTVEHRYVVMEYAMFYTWHVAELTRLLKPTIGILLNVATEHLGVDGIRTHHDVLNAKKALLERATHALVEHDVAQQFSEDLPAAQVFDWNDFVRPAGFDVEPFVKSRLQYIQIGAALSAKAILAGPVTFADIEVLNGFEPKENRLRKIRCRRHQIFFDGEVTAPVRLNALGDTMYPSQTLAIHNVSDGNDDYELDLALQSDRLRSALCQFNTIYISRTVEPRFRELAQSCSSGSTSVMLYDNQIPDLAPDVTLFVHWGGYWRTHKDGTPVVDAF